MYESDDNSHIAPKKCCLFGDQVSLHYVPVVCGSYIMMLTA
jgi:hypothetical protein